MTTCWISVIVCKPPEAIQTRKGIFNTKQVCMSVLV